MPKTKVHVGVQVEIPFNIASKYKLQQGDSLEVHDIGGGIVFVPLKAKRNKKLHQQLNERLWDRMEEEASEAIAKGELSKPFSTVDDLMAHLRKQDK